MATDYASIAGFLAGLKPVDILSVSEWADKYRRLSAKAAAEPGPWRTDRVPYLRKIQDALTSNNGIGRVVVMKGAQLGLTEAGNNWVAYTMHIDPAPMLMVMPTADTMKRNSEIRIDPMIEATPVLREKIKPARSRDSGNKMMQKEFPGGILMMAGANSAAGLRSMPAKKLFLDEVDGYPSNLDGEGSPIALATARTRTFRDRKIYVISTPTLQGSSVIEKEFDASEQQYYYVPCPHCGATQTLAWAQMKWRKDVPKIDQPNTTYYECLHCEGRILELHKDQMLAAGEWVITKPQNVSADRVGFHINSLYSPFYTWAEIVREWHEAQGNTELLMAFTNTVLGEVWTQEGDAPEWERLYERREDFDGQTVVPNAVGVITAGADIQKDRIEVEVVGWAEGNESWSLAYHVLSGNTERPEVWEQLAALMGSTFRRADGVQMTIRTMAVDTGYLAQSVYEFAKNFPADRVIPIKGQDSQRIPVAAPQAVNRRLKNGKRAGTVRLVNIGVSILKTELYGWLKLKRNEDGSLPPGYPHFPTLYDEHFFKMLTAEKLVYKAATRGYGKYEWVKHFERNEALDCRVYARAAAIAVGIDRMNAEDWKERAPLAEAEETAEALDAAGMIAEAAHVLASAAPAAPTPPPPKPVVKRKSSFWKK